MIHLPILRAGRPYHSLSTIQLCHVSSGEPVATVSQANTGLITRDLAQAAENRRAVQELSTREILAICKKAADLFYDGDLPLDGESQTPAVYLRQLASTTGMPESLGRRNMDKIRFVLAEMETVLSGLTRGLDLQVLDRGCSVGQEQTVSYLRQADMMGCVLPANSPGVHSLWIPSVALKVPLVLRPGRREPWTPFRIAQALLAAGCPPQAVSFYPSDYAGANEIVLRCDRSMVFGDVSTVRPWKDDPRVQIHGPGWSKVLLDDDQLGDWEQHLEVMLTSIGENAGRSCVNASGVWVTGRGDEIAEALARRLATVEARSLDDPEAQLAAFAPPAQAHRLSEYIDRQLKIPGAEDVTARLRQGERVVERDGLAFLLPTVIRCDDPGHPLAAAEFLFPFVSVVQVERQELLERIGPTLVATVLSDDPDFRRQAMDCRHVDRLNLGPFPTTRIPWDQPHEGNLFEHLYRQRAFQSVGETDAA